MSDAALIVLYDRDGTFLLQHRTDDAPKYPGLWGFFGGGVEAGETPLEAVRRECYEELQYHLKKPLLVLRRLRDDRGHRYFFIELCEDKGALVLCEGQGMRWVSLAEAQELMMAPFHRDVITEISEKIKEKINTFF